LLAEEKSSIKKQREIEGLLKKGASFSGKILKTRQLFRAGGRARRIIIVSSKFGGAVKRNKLKRKIKEAWRKLQARIKRGADIALIPKEGAAEATVFDLEKDMEGIFKNAKILEEN